MGFELLYSLANSKVFFKTTGKEIKFIIKNLGTGSTMGRDGTPTKMLKIAKHFIIPIIKHIVLLSTVVGCSYLVIACVQMVWVMESGEFV